MVSNYTNLKILLISTTYALLFA